MQEIERPAAVLVAAGNHDRDGLADTAIGFDRCVAKVIEPAQHIVMPERRERETEPALVNDFAASERTEHAALEQKILGAPARLRNGRGLAAGAFVFE